MNLTNFTNTTRLWSFQGFKTRARVVNVHDGDTLSVVFYFFDNVYKFNIRLAGIDACEIRNKDQGLLLKAHQARNRILQLIGVPNVDLEVIFTDKQVVTLLEEHLCMVDVHCRDFDKYGRILADVYPSILLTPTLSSTPITKWQLETIASILLKESLVYCYNGGTKLTPAEQRNQLSV